MASESSGQIRVFFCYAHEDEALLERLKTHLIALQRQRLIEMWHDRNISAGTPWEHEIDRHLNSADIIMLLVSPDFMASEYCYSIEMERAMQRHERGEARVIPVILRPVYFKGAPFGKLQALPTDAKPIISSHWQFPDEAFFNVAEGLREAIEQLTLQRRFAAASRADNDEALLSAYMEIQQSPYHQSLTFTPQEQQRIQLAYQRRAALQRFRDALKVGKPQEIVEIATAVHGKDKVLTDNERTLLGFAHRFSRAYTAHKDDDLIDVYEKIINSPFRGAFVFSQDELSYISNIQRRRMQKVPASNGGKSPSLKLVAASKTDVGRIEEQNDDLPYMRIESFEEGDHGLFIVADGLRGRQIVQGSGECVDGYIASELAVDAVSRSLNPFFKPLADQGIIRVIVDETSKIEKASYSQIRNVKALLEEGIEQRFINAIQKANKDILRYAQRHYPAEKPLACVLTAALLLGRQAFIANVGGSRVYLLRANALYLLTRDHSLVMRMVEANRIASDEVYTHRQRHLVYRSLGAAETVEVDISHETLQPGEKLLLCSAGLWQMARDQEIGRILAQKCSPQQECDDLVNLANQNSGERNITAVVVHVS